MNDEQLERYSRHINLPQMGQDGQQKLVDSHALIVGMGGLGSPVALYLASSGVGKLTLADFDQVELSNLQRQIAHTTDRIGELKTHSARTACLQLNPGLEIDTIDYALDEDDLDAIVARVDIVIEGSDNFPTRFAVNAACVRNRKPLVSGASIRFDGQITVFRADLADSPCYRCLYSDTGQEGDTCALTGVLAPMVGMVGCMQAIETIKVLAGFGRTLESRLVLLDGLSMEWNEIKLNRNPECPVCSINR
ncbi:MAG: molybdopterin-synthase adenylyltransferase MoeB [Gammaproteobacteria bacterium]|nr:molybdopterin-synthase adenylyltransferase MoeB [Gammaproteobacteria bacterium]